MRITLPPQHIARSNTRPVVCACTQQSPHAARLQRRATVSRLAEGASFWGYTCCRGSRLRPGLRLGMRAALRTMTRAQELSPRKLKCLPPSKAFMPPQPACPVEPAPRFSRNKRSPLAHGALSERVQSAAGAAFAVVWCASGCSASSGVVGVICRVSTCARCALGWCVVQA